MKRSDRKHLPQIEYFYQGNYIYPLVAGLNLSELIALREEWLNYDSPILYQRNVRKTFQSQLNCIEQCICILLSEPTPERTLALQQKQKTELKSLKITDKNMLAIMKNIES